MKAIRQVKTLKTMDSSDTISKPTDEDSKKHSEGKHRNRTADDCDFLQPFWVRRAFRANHEVDRFLLDYGCYLLLPLGILLWSLFLMA